MREIKFRYWIFHNINPMMDYYIHTDLDDIDINLFLNQLSNLMQYTGQTDKNGKEIWEGDIVTRTDIDNNYGEVYWDNLTSSFIIAWINKNNPNKDMLPSRRMINILIKNYQVIGNIYENPEWRIIKNE